MKNLKDILPWEDRPQGCKDVMWRYSQNPIIHRYDIRTVSSTVPSFHLEKALQGCSVATTKLCR